MGHNAPSCFSSCKDCLCALSRKIYDDLTGNKSNNSSFATHDEIVKNATKRVQNFIKLLEKD